jgi:hypothetical protein
MHSINLGRTEVWGNWGLKGRRGMHLIGMYLQANWRAALKSSTPSRYVISLCHAMDSKVFVQDMRNSMIRASCRAKERENQMTCAR